MGKRGEEYLRPLTVPWSLERVIWARKQLQVDVSEIRSKTQLLDEYGVLVPYYEGQPLESRPSEIARRRYALKPLSLPDLRFTNTLLTKVFLPILIRRLLLLRDKFSQDGRVRPEHSSGC